MMTLLLTLSVAGAAAAGQTPQPFAVNTITAAPGTTVSGTLSVPARPGDEGTTIPVSVIHGTTDGPVLALIAGTHGMEYVPVIALQRLRAAIDPTTLRGTVVMVHVANMRRSSDARSTTRRPTART